MKTLVKKSVLLVGAIGSGASLDYELYSDLHLCQQNLYCLHVPPLLQPLFQNGASGQELVEIWGTMNAKSCSTQSVPLLYTACLLLLSSLLCFSLLHKLKTMPASPRHEVQCPAGTVTTTGLGCVL